MFLWVRPWMRANRRREPGPRKSGGRPAAKLPTHLRRARFERLEDRSLLSVVTWANAAGHANWNDTAAWVGGVVPGAADTAAFPSAASVVTPNLPANASVQGITIDDSQAAYSITGTATLMIGSGGISVSHPGSTATVVSTISPNVSLAANQSFTATNNTGTTTLIVSGVLSGSGRLTQNGNGIVLLSAANAYSGGTSATSGMLVFQTPSAVPSGSSLVVAAGGRVNLGGTPQVGPATDTWANAAGHTNWNDAAAWVGGILPGPATTVIFPSAAAVVNPNLSANASVAGITMDDSQAAYSITGTGTLTVGSGGISMSHPGSTSAAGTTISANLSLAAADSFTVTNNTGLTTLTLTGTVSDGYALTTQGSGNINLNGAVSGAGGLFQAGSGTLTLAGANTNSGSTAVNSGVLLVNGSTASGSSVTVNSGGTLGGTGTIAGAISVASGGTISAGSAGSTGVLSAGSLTLASGAAFNAQIKSSTAGSGYDQINVSGAVNLGGATLTLSGTRTAGNGSQLTLIGSGGLTGAFANLPEGAHLTVHGVPYAETYLGGSGSSMVLTDISGTPLTNPDPFGVGSSAQESGSYTTYLPTMGQAGVDWYRVGFNYGTVEPTQGTFNWTSTDAVMASVTSNNMDASGLLGYDSPWDHVFTASLDSTSGNPAPALELNDSGTSSGDAAISLASSGSYTKPGSLTIQADIELGTFSSTSSGNGMLLGFYSSRPSAGSSPLTNFTGLAVGPTGGITLFQNGSASGSTIAYTGTFSETSFLTLAYTVNTSSGAISGVTFKGSTSTYSFSSTAFINTATAYAVVGAYDAGSDLNPYGEADNFSVTGSSQTIVSDDFSGSGAVAGRTPDRADLPGGTWQGESSASTTSVFPANITAWSAYVTATVTRYSSEVKYWEVWNEPENFAVGGTPAAYAGVVSAAYTAAHAADATCMVGMSVASVDTTYLTQAIQTLVADGEGNDFDYIIVHPYEVFGAISSGWEADYMSIVNTIHKMLAANDPAKANCPVWITEVGESTANLANLTVNNTGNLSGYNATVVNSASITNGGLNASNALDIPGSGSYLQMTSSSLSLSGGAWTASAWFKGLFSNGSGNYETLFHASGSGSDAQVTISESNHHLGTWVNGAFYDSGYSVSSLYGSTAWHQLTVVGTGNTTTFYIDGVHVGSTIAHESTSNIYAVGNYQSGGQQFARFLDNVQLFQSALTATQVQALYAGAGPTADVAFSFDSIGSGVTMISQAQDLVKGYTMGIAEGFSHIEWFEAMGTNYSMGLLDSWGNPNLPFTAYGNLIAELGAAPQYLGWVQINVNADYGFVFQGASTTVLALWAVAGTSENVTFSSNVRVVDPLTGILTYLAAGSQLALTPSPLLVLDVPSNLVSEAAADKSQPFPWGGNYSGATTVTVTAGATNVEQGLHWNSGSSAAWNATVGGRWAGANSAQQFTVDPNFLSYTGDNITISVVVCETSSSDDAGFNLKYESVSGWAGIGWNNVTSVGSWQTISFTIPEGGKYALDEFHSDWAYNFDFDSDSTTYSNYYIQSVSVTKNTSLQVSLSSSFNAHGMYGDGSTFSATGGLDGGGFAYSATTLGTRLSNQGTSYAFGSATGNNAVNAAGQTISLTAGNYSALTFLGAASNGSQTGTFTVDYSDGTQQTFTQTLSDWTAGSTAAGEMVASTMSYRDKYDGTKDTRSIYLYKYTFLLNAAKTVSGLTLPNNTSIHLLAVDLLE